MTRHELDGAPTHTDFVRSADGTRLAVRRLGRGSPVLMLHGSGGGFHSWAGVADRLSREHELWLLARRGYAPSGIATPPKSFAQDVADVAAVVTAAGEASGTPVHLVGASYGAIVALHMAAEFPVGIRSLALFEPPLFARGEHLVPVLDRYRALVAHGDLAAANRLLLLDVARVPKPLAEVLTAAGTGLDARAAIGWLHDLEALAADSGAARRWSGIAVPTLLMQGAETWEPMPTTMDQLASTLPRLHRVVWEGQLHFATSTAPDLVAEELRRFWHEQESSAGVPG
ncbi:alpha/beta fold hydrolase [Lysobacter korlensis]|uniref:Alpha/beta fold hydrolase n=1 Tax=Lysobacter korlensis TaxID=553636 RepID=A0ABV6RU71_9GAMM